MKNIILTILLILVTATAYAEKQEYINKEYDFSRAKKIYFHFAYLPNGNGIKENETEDLNFEYLTKLWSKAKNKGYQFYYSTDIIDIINKEKSINLDEISQKNPEKAETIYQEYIKENMDMTVMINVLAYDIGSQYREGYFINMPSTETSYINTPYSSATITTYGTQQQYVRGGNVPVSYCCVRMMVFDMATSNRVWVRIDDRAKVNATVFDNTKPKDMYKRILNNYYNDFEKITMKQ